MRRLASTLAIAIAMPLLAGSASAQTAPNIWSNPNGGSWNDPSNWSLKRVPDTFDVAIFDLAGPLDVTTIDAVALLLHGGWRPFVSTYGDSHVLEIS